MSLSCIPKTPMWLGFNVKNSLDRSPMQIVEYLPPINMSPTSYSVIHETMMYAKNIAEECGQSQIIATYDLAIAKMANQIKISKSLDTNLDTAEKFDNLFINLGAFHTEVAFFKALGKVIDGSGIVDILVSSQVLAEGSVNTFLESKHFNRCKRIYPILADALQVLHFENFLKQSDYTDEFIKETLEFVLECPSESTQPLNLKTALKNIVTEYSEFTNLTLCGTHGKTAQFYMQLIELIKLYFRFSRAIRISDGDLYIDTLFSMCNIFFALNQQNYARWTVKYVCDLIELKQNDTESGKEFQKGSFGIERIEIPSAGSHIDITLEDYERKCS